MQTVKAIEVVIFKTKVDISEDKAKEILMSLNPILSSYQGFIKRQLSKNDDGIWHDLVHWESMEAAKNASNEIMKTEKAMSVFSIIEQETMQFFHFTPMNNYKLN